MAQNKDSFRTPEELEDLAFNYYIAFNIGVEEKNIKKITEQIKRALGNPSGGLYNRRLLALKDDIFQIMENDAVYDPSTGKYTQNAGGRKKEADAAKSLKLRSARDGIQIMAQTRKELLLSELNNICDSMNKPVVYFTIDELKKEIAPILKLGIKIIDNVNLKIPFRDYDNVEIALKTVKKSSIYEFLDCDQNSSDDVLKQKKTEKYAEFSKSSNLSLKQASSNLCSFVDKMLHPGEKVKYDQYLAVKERVWDEIAKLRDLGARHINLDDYAKYLKIIMETLQISNDDAEQMFGVGCSYYRMTIEGGEIDSFDVCPNKSCGRLIKKGTKVCPHCGESIEKACWNCGQPYLTTKFKSCPHCNASVSSQKLFENKCRDFDNILLKHDVTIHDLQNALLDVKNIVPGADKDTKSVIGKKIHEFQVIVDNKVREENAKGTKYRTDFDKVKELIGKKNYESAYSIAIRMEQSYGSYRADETKLLLSKIKVVISQINTEMTKAKLYVSQCNKNMAIASAVKILQICADCNDAKMILQQFPPCAVTSVKATASGNKIRIDWIDNSGESNITYKVIKKVGVAPVNVEDGVVICSGTSIKFFEDEAVSPGTEYYYSVVSDRYGVSSQLCSVLSPIVIYTDVTDISQQFIFGGIKVLWTLPQNVSKVEVWKKQGSIAPLSSSDGTAVQCDLKGFYDENASGENSYLIICCYKKQGRDMHSKGVKILLKPYQRTAPLEDISITYESGNSYIFNCKSGYNGSVAIYYSPRKIAVETNKVLKFMDFASNCRGLTKLNIESIGNEQIRFNLPSNSIGYVYPMVITDQLFVISPCVLVNTRSGISNLTHTFQDGVLNIQGIIDSNVNSIVVKINDKNYPESLSSPGDNYNFSKVNFEKTNEIQVRLRPDTMNYVTIFAEYKLGDDTIWTHGIKLSKPIDYRQQIDVLYALKYAVSALKPFKINIKFSCSKPITIPPLVLIKGRDGLRPRNITMGEVCEKIDEITLKKGLFSNKYTATLNITVRPAAVNSQYGVFTSDGSNFIYLKEVKTL